METLRVQIYPPSQEKILRIKQLAEWGLNTPRMAYFPKSSRYDRPRLNEFLKTHSKSKKFNIRTYTYDKTVGQEGWSSKHYVGLRKNEVFKTMEKIISTHYCMVDAEIPDDGRYAGNAVIQSDGYCVIEYYEGRGAMVRMADRSLAGDVDYVVNDLLSNRYFSLAAILTTILSINKRDILFEWSVLANPGGVKLENSIFWEWRFWLPVSYTGTYEKDIVEEGTK